MLASSSNSNAAAQAGSSNRSAPAPRSVEAVLGEVLVNQSAVLTATSAGQVEDEDLALAKVLQEQERAFVMFSGASSGRLENVPPANLGSGAPSARTGSPDLGAGLTDEQLAWQLMQEEEQAFQGRLVAMAGAVPANGGDDGEASTDAGDADPDAMSYEELTALGEVVGTVSTGVSQAQLAVLPRSAYSACRVPACAGQVPASHIAEEEQCAVCRVEYEDEDEVSVLPCKHIYHVDCIAQWLLHKKVCPQCNEEVTGLGAQEPSDRQ